jgi:hypothetical protein
MRENIAIGKAVIEHLATKGYSANQIIREATKLGGSYRRAEMLADIRAASQRFKGEYWVKKLDPLAEIPSSLMVQKKLKYPANFRVYGDYTFYDRLADEVRTETRSMHVDRVTSKFDLEVTYEEEFTKNPSDEQYEFIAFNVKAIEMNI